MKGQGLVGSFRYLNDLLEAVEQVREAGYGDLPVLSPVYHEAIDKALEKPTSPVRFYTLIGCLLGTITGFVLTIATALHYPLITGGKPIVSIPPFLIIVFELTILFGGLFTLAGMLLNARLPRMHAGPAYDPCFSEDRFGLWVQCEAPDHDQVSRLLEGAGAEEVRHVGR
jgi:hypothetical protein